MNPPILTAVMARYWIDSGDDADDFLLATHAIEQGRTVVVEVMTEAQALDDYGEWTRGRESVLLSEVWLAALRHAGVLK